MKRRQVNVHAGKAAVNPVAGDKRDQHDSQENQQGGFATRKQGRTELSSALRREVVNQFGDSPQDDQKGPVNSRQVADTECGVEPVNQKNQAKNNQQQARENRSSSL
jgi:hypothetical protein